MVRNLSETSIVTNGLAVSLETVAVRYPLEFNRPTSLKEYIIRQMKRDIHRQYLTALKDVSTEIPVGETFGVIGRNGAGKSTLLKVIAHIIQPTSGRMQVWGKVVSLLGVGAGFHPELSGKENVFLYSALLGRPQSFTLEHYGEIVEFSELDDFIDSPIRTYSSGMIARLGFAVAMIDRPDVLLVDEVLGVGDEFFRDKCRQRFNEFRSAGTTLIIVSHSLGEIEKLCQRAMWLHEGNVKQVGQAVDVVNAYKSFKFDH
jgi:ABC-type polysaccharide/polyol phosphate transport system ATPase subunit